MPDIEIVIKISEKEYNEIKENKYGVFSGHVFEMIRKGRPLAEYYPVPLVCHMLEKMSDKQESEEC